MTRAQRADLVLRNAHVLEAAVLRELEDELDAELELLAREAYFEGPASR